MIYFFKTHSALVAESKVNSSVINRHYLRAMVGDINIQGVRGFAFNIGTQSFFLVTNRRKIRWGIARKIAKQYMTIFGKGPWEHMTLASHIYRKNQRGVASRLAYGEMWDILGSDYPFYGFDNPVLVVDL